MTEVATSPVSKSLAPGTLKAKHLMRRSLRGESLFDTPFGSRTAFESVKSPMNKPGEAPFSVTASQIPPREIRYDPDRLV